MKTQAVRVIDVIALGPLMLWIASRERVPEWARFALAVGGVATIVYNAANYAAERDAGREDYLV